MYYYITLDQPAGLFVWECKDNKPLQQRPITWQLIQFIALELTV
jgi:hypothetical protein